MNALAAILLLATTPEAAVQHADVAAEAWGTTRAGMAVERFTLVNDRGMRVRAIGWGATLTAIEVPDRDGHAINVVLNLPDLAAYERSTRRWAGIVGRYAGRIDRSGVAIDGRTFRLEPGRNGVTLHGGGTSYDRRVWQGTRFSDARSIGVVFRLVSPDGDQGFPGRLDVSVTYRLARGSNDLTVDYRATTDRPTVLNLTNHGFFNMAGAGSGNVAGQILRLAAGRYAETDARKIPTGRLLSVAGTPLDFLGGASIGARDERVPGGIDHSMVLPGGIGLRPAATLTDPASGRRLDILTTAPSLQINTGGGFDRSETGGEGVPYAPGAGIAIETQSLPDSPHRPAFPSTLLRPGRVYRVTTVYRFSVLPARS